MYEIDDIRNKILLGDAREELEKIPSDSIDCIVTSCPYWGLRDYGDETKVVWGGNKDCEHEWGKRKFKVHSGRGDAQKSGKYSEQEPIQDIEKTDAFCSKCGAWYGQLGLEPTLDMFLEHLLAITSELRRVLKPTGVMFWNHGDCYGGSGGSGGDYNEGGLREGQPKVGRSGIGIQAKCLALQNYRLILKMLDDANWEIGNEGDRKWMAALVDGEGCVTAHKRYKNRKNPTYGPLVEICNTNKEIIDYAQGMFGSRGSRSESDRNRNQRLYRWRLMSNDARDLLTEIYPFLIAKRRQARTAIAMPSSGDRAEEAWKFVKSCNHGGKSEGDWPEPKCEPRGDRWILRNVIQWFKPNAMPSSVKDRFSNCYEPVFMLVKNNDPIYCYNTKTGLMTDRKPKELKEGIDWDWKADGEDYPEGSTKIPPKEAEKFSSPRARGHREKSGKKVSHWKSLSYWFDLDAVRKPHAESSKQRVSQPNIAKQFQKGKVADFGNKEMNIKEILLHGLNPAGKNPGDVWKIPTQPLPEAHFATFPEKLITPMILSSCPQWICKKCGKARVRIIEKPDMSQRPRRGDAAKTKEDKHLGFKDRSAGQKYQEWRNKNPDKTVGWTDCGCESDWEAGIVLDPFMGSGTTAMVAKKLGRSYLGIELKEDYIKMAKKRLQRVSEPMKL